MKITWKFEFGLMDSFVKYFVTTENVPHTYQIIPKMVANDSLKPKTYRNSILPMFWAETNTFLSTLSVCGNNNLRWDMKFFDEYIGFFIKYFWFRACNFWNICISRFSTLLTVHRLKKILRSSTFLSEFYRWISLPNKTNEHQKI